MTPPHPGKPNPYHPDVALFLVLIPFISAFDYYLTYSNRGLMEERLLSAATLELMKNWTRDKEGNFTYGLGLDYATFHGQTALGHSAGGIGAGCQLYYFPEKKIYFFVAINLGTVTDSPLHAAATTTLDKIHAALLK